MKITPVDSTLDISRNQNQKESFKSFYGKSPALIRRKFRSPESTENPEDDYSNYQSYIAEELNDSITENLPKEATNMIRISRPFRMRWDLVMIIIALYNAISAPFIIAFYHRVDEWFFALNILLDIFYYIDIGVNFFTTYIDSTDDEIFSHKKIIFHYLSRDFALDLISALPVAEFIFLTNDKEDESKKLWLILNMIKSKIVISRLNRLIRFARTKDYVKVLMRLGELTLYVFLWVHLTTCLWFYVIRDNEDWIPTTDFLTKVTEFYASDVAKQYTTVFYNAVWLLVGNDVAPRTQGEACLASFLIIIGSIAKAVIFGEMVVLMSSLSLKQDQYQETLDGAMTTMRGMKLPSSLQSKILDYIAATHTSSSSQEEYETFKKFISPSLQQEVSASIYDPIISKNASLQNEERMFYMLIRKLSNRFSKPEDEIIIEGAEPDNIYFLVNGEVQVFVTDKNMKKNTVCFLSPGAQFGELGLIYDIHRTATVISHDYCTIAELSKKNFESLVLSFPMLKNKMIRAAEVYDDPWKNFLLDSLSQAEYFETLPRQIFRELPYRMEIIKLEKGGYLFKPGEIPNCIYLIAFGELEVSVTINEKHLHLLKAHEHFPNIENEPRVPKNHKTLEDYKDYYFDIFKADSLKKKAEIVPIMDQKSIIGSIRLDEEVPEKSSMIGDYPQEIVLGNITQSALISSTFIYTKMPYLFQCKALNAVTVYKLKFETIKKFAKNHTAFRNEIKEIKSEVKGKKYPNILDIIEPDTPSSRVKKLWISVILRVIVQLRKERKGGVGLLLQITSKLKAIIACEEAENFDLAEKVARGDIPPHYILEDGTLDPAAISSNINSSLPANHPMMMALKAMLDSITQPGGNIVRQYNILDKKILHHSKIIQNYGKSLDEIKDTLRKVIKKLKGNIDESEPEKLKDQLPKLLNVEETKRKEMMKLDIQKVYVSEEERLKKREVRKLAKLQRKNDRASINEAVIKARPQIEEIDRPKDLISFSKESKE